MYDIIDSTDDIEKARTITKNITKILGSEKENDPVDIEIFHFLDGIERVLGMSWLPHGDEFKYSVKLNFSKRKGKVRTEPDLNLDDIDLNIPVNLIKRMILSQLNGIFDPVGLLTPFIIKGKILMRQLWVAGTDWDDPVLVEMRQKWVAFFKEMFELTQLSFKRSVKPENTAKNPVLVIFSDASKEAYGACCYIRWELSNGSYKSMLLLSKSKIAPVKTITIVRLELLAAVISKRLRDSIKKECRYRFERVFHILDSEIVRAMIQRESYGYNTFTSTKIGEIQEGTDPEDWDWVNGEYNIADIISRGESPRNLNTDSEWQSGPSFLKLPIEDWPIRKDWSIDTLPEQTEVVMIAQLNISHTEIISAERFSKFIKLMRVTARILAIRKEKP